MAIVMVFPNIATFQWQNETMSIAWLLLLLSNLLVLVTMKVFCVVFSQACLQC